MKKVLLILTSVIVSSAVVLVVHIYIVTKTGFDTTTRVLARIDFKQDIDDRDAIVIYSWLSQQKGVDRVMCNTASNNVVFIYSPALTNGNTIANGLISNLHYQAERYMPNSADMQKGCPMSETSASYKVYSFIKNIF